MVQYFEYCFTSDVYLALSLGHNQGKTHPMVQEHLLSSTCNMSSADDGQCVSQWKVATWKKQT